MKPVRPSMSKVRRARIFEAHKGLCGLCGKKITGDYDIEHRIPWAISFDDSDGNLYPAHKDGHALKTKQDVKDIAKAKRLAGETGQNRIKKSIPSRPFDKPKEKKPWPKRGFSKPGKPQKT